MDINNLIKSNYFITFKHMNFPDYSKDIIHEFYSYKVAKRDLEEFSNDIDLLLDVLKFSVRIQDLVMINLIQKLIHFNLTFTETDQSELVKLYNRRVMYDILLKKLYISYRV